LRSWKPAKPETFTTQQLIDYLLDRVPTYKKIAVQRLMLRNHDPPDERINDYLIDTNSV
jgi:hypothetical protein